jgi:carbonic anhydrase/acetyltransferase-like protein (isoleucine patch superfamily)
MHDKGQIRDRGHASFMQIHDRGRCVMGGRCMMGSRCVIRGRCMIRGRCVMGGRYMIGDDSSLKINVPLNFVFKW